MGSDFTATGRHLPYGITQCYLLPDDDDDDDDERMCFNVA